MIEIKNKRMILFREDRLIGATGDVDTSQRKFILDAVQGEYDLSKMVAWIKIDPKFPGESPYDQMLKKEIVGDKIILTWQLTAKNLQRAGEISAQVIFASPNYFIQDELDSILGGSLILPSPIEGKSAPVWQSYPETFVVEESISNTEGYKELTKNVLVSAVAEALSSAESAQNAAEAALYSEESARSFCNNTENTHEVIEKYYGEIKDCKREIDENLEASRECLQGAEYSSDKAYNYMAVAEQSSERAEQNAQSAQKVLSAVKKARDFRLIYKKTLTAEDTDCYSFEITEDTDGNPFLLSEFTIFAHIPTMADMKSSYIQVRIQPNNQTANGEREYGVVTQFIGVDKTKDCYHRIECANRGRWRANLVRGSAWNQNGDVVYHTGSVCSTSRFTDGKNATSIVFCGTSSIEMPFPEGTMVEIWGVDAIGETE